MISGVFFFRPPLAASPRKVSERVIFDGAGVWSFFAFPPRGFHFEFAGKFSGWPAVAGLWLFPGLPRLAFQGAPFFLGWVGVVFVFFSYLPPRAFWARIASVFFFPLIGVLSSLKFFFPSANCGLGGFFYAQSFGDHVF